MTNDSSKNGTPPPKSTAARLLVVRTTLNNDAASEKGLLEAYEKLAACGEVACGYDMYVVQPWTRTPPPDEATAIRTMMDAIRK